MTRRDRRGRPAADQLGRVRVPLVRHHRAAGRVRLGDPDEPEPRVRPPGDLLGEPAEVDHPERDGRQRLDDEVAIADGIERVRGHAVEPELRRRRLAIERVARAGERAAPERADVQAAAGVGEPAAIALGHLDVGEQVMAEQHRLGRLGVGRARAGPRRRRARRGRRARPRTASRPASSRSIARRVQSRRSVATWSFRERPGVEPPGDGPDAARRARPRG